MTTSTSPAEAPVRVALSAARKQVVKTVVASAAVPQFWVEREANLTRITAHLAQLPAPAAYGMTDVLVAAVAQGVAASPSVNLQFDGDALLDPGTVNVGVLMPVGDALVAPGIIGADRLSLEAIHGERMRLSDAARSNSLKIADALSATITISNLGPAGIDRFTAMVLPPQAAVLAIGRVRPDGRASFVLSVDHRVVDGLAAAAYLDAVVVLLERVLTNRSPEEP